jgi:uncharacterized membrane protein YoaK (UPF0700 family)
MSDHGHTSHGNSPAAWACVAILIVAAFLMALAVIVVSVPLFVVGAVVVVVGVVVGKVLSLAGYGTRAPHRQDAPNSIR